MDPVAAPTLTSRRGRRGVSIAGRLSLQLVLLSLLLTAGAAWFSIAQVARAFERQLVEELDRMLAEVDSALEAMAGEVEASLAGLERELTTRERETLERLLLGGTGLREVAGRLARSAALDRLEIVGADGVVISSTWEERAGLPAGDGLLTAEREAGVASLALLRGAGDTRVGLLGVRAVSVGGRHLELVGGRELGRGFLQQVAGAEAAALFLADGGAPLLVSPPAGIDLRDLKERSGESFTSQDAARVPGGDGSSWEARWKSLIGPGGRALATVVVAVDRSGLDSTLRGVRRGFAILALAAGLIAALAGVLIARGISRPLRDLVRAFDSVAAGEADYSFPAARQDELQELVASVSRLRRALEDQRRRSVAAERVATWREVARHVAHEVKNPLAPIRLTVENLLRARQKAPERFETMFPEGMRTILEEVDQLRRMVEEFSAFARLPLPNLRPENIERLIDAVLDLYASEPRLQIRRRYSGGLEAVPVDADQMARAMKNVVGNAVEAMGRSESAQLRLEVTTFVEEDAACVTVADDGPGFSAESLDRVFEPYFTTRSGGTGLGMALTYRIIVDHGGMISVANGEGGGAEVTLRLPLRPTPPPSRRNEQVNQ